MVKIQTSFSHGMILHMGLFEIEILGHLPQKDISLLYEVMTSDHNKQWIKRIGRHGVELTPSIFRDWFPKRRDYKG